MLKKNIGHFFELKEKSIGPPEIYLGGCTHKVMLENGVKAWAFGSSQYVQACSEECQSVPGDEKPESSGKS